MVIIQAYVRGWIARRAACQDKHCIVVIQVGVIFNTCCSFLDNHLQHICFWCIYVCLQMGFGVNETSDYVGSNSSMYDFHQKNKLIKKKCNLIRTSESISDHSLGVC